MLYHPATGILQKLAAALQQGVSDEVFSGAQVSFCINGDPIHTTVAGHTRYRDGVPITQDTLFDTASLTKLFTATVALGLVNQHRLQVHTPIGNKYSLQSLLAHESGLPAWKPFFEDVPMTLRGTLAGYRQIIAAAQDTAPIHPAPEKAVYSDIGFITLAHQLEHLTEQSLPELVRSIITEPLQMQHTVFAPDLPTDHTHIAATEACQWRDHILQGEVHDDNAWAMGGIAGHAGIFSTSEDMVRLGEAWRSALTTDGIVCKELAREAIRRRPGGRGLGFDIKTPGASSAGASASDETFGHLGFTGTSLWIDPRRNAVIALLTNRVHPTRDNNKIRDFRPYFHELFFSAV